VEIEENHNPKIKVLPITKLFPSIITLVALCLGLSSIRFALQFQWTLAVSMIVIAAFLDVLDGRIARLLNATSSFGAHLDSLADFLNFGIAPPLTIYMWSLKNTPVKGLGWATVLFFVVCCAIRLARFNTDLDSEDKPHWAEGFFVGIPSTFGGFLAIVPMMLEIEYDIILSEYSLLLSLYLAIIALLMVSKIPTFSTKKIAIPHEFISLTLVILGLVIAGILMEPWVVLPIIALIYLFTIPLSMAYYKKIKRNLKKYK
jgi:CDP-diacylglycerol--serine O-phosphatidyltransferase